VILVTGGAGFLGGWLVERLAKTGETVRVFDLPMADVSRLPKDNVEFARGDIRDRQAVREAVKGCRHVYHLAGNPQLWTPNADDFDAVNRQGSVNVLEAAADAGAERILHCSTESILGLKVGEDADVMTFHPKLEDMIGDYCRSKLLGEEAAFALAAKGAPIVVAAPTLPVGPGDVSRTPPTRMTVSFCRGELPAYLDCRFNMIDARDAAAGLQAALEKGRFGVRYLIGHRNVDLIEWLEIVGGIVGRKPPRWRVPYPVALGAAWFSERWANFVSHRPPNATLTGVRLTRRDMHFDPGPTLAELGVSPRPLEESAADAVGWYRLMGWIDG
jgi:dihydroflavonol-4-reductase